MGLPLSLFGVSFSLFFYLVPCVKVFFVHSFDNGKLEISEPSDNVLHIDGFLKNHLFDMNFTLRVVE